MTDWTAGTLVSFDCETTGADPETARIVTASVVVIDGTTGAVDTHEWLIDPGMKIPAEATAIHGVTTEHAREHGTDPATAIPHIYSTLCANLSGASTLVIYNAPYDLTLLDREMRRHTGMSAIVENLPRVVDPLVIDRALDRYRKGSRKLVDVSKYYRVPISDEDAHGSTADALCAARVAWKIGRIYPEQCADLDVLQVWQANWYRQSSNSFREYLIRERGKLTAPDEIAAIQAKIDGVRFDWPMVPYRQEVSV